jgi:hypothetical protein
MIRIAITAEAFEAIAGTLSRSAGHRREGFHGKRHGHEVLRSGPTGDDADAAKRGRNIS